MPPRPRDYRAEYQARLARARRDHVPTNVARGHGPVPLRIARGLERQRAGGKALPAKTLRKYRKGIGRYERRQWGELGTAREVLGKSRAGVPVPIAFRTRESAEEWLEEAGIPTTEEYVEFKEMDGTWRVWRLS